MRIETIIIHRSQANVVLLYVLLYHLLQDKSALDLPCTDLTLHNIKCAKTLFYFTCNSVFVR